MKYTIFSENVPNLPFAEGKSEGNSPFWRYKGNPIVERNPVEGIARIYNSAVVPYEGGFVGVFRGDTTNGWPFLYLGRSKDGFTFTFEKEPIVMEHADGTPYRMEYGYDPRLVLLEGKYYAVWCDSLRGQPTIGLAVTEDFKKFRYLGQPVLPYSRNGVLFPRKVGGEYKLLTRPSDQGHTPYGDIYLSSSKDLEYWGRHAFVMGPANNWERLKIGAGCAPVETSAGWLLLYHGVMLTCSGYVYSVGGAILDREDPAKVLYRSKDFLLTPEKAYECVGVVPNVCFPCSAVVDAATGRLAMYYGCADTVFSLAFSTVDAVVDFIIAHS